MRNAEELKKYKELLDAGVITAEEFEKRKRELLFGDVQEENAVSETREKKNIFKKLNKSLLKKILIVVGIIAILVVAFFVGQKIIENKQRTERAAALEAEIAPIMDDYGLTAYTVKYCDSDYYEIFAEGFEFLTNGEALELLTELDEVTVNDPCGDGKIGFATGPLMGESGTAKVHPGLDVEYSYYRKTSSEAAISAMWGHDYKPGIYCNRYGDECVFECPN